MGARNVRRWIWHVALCGLLSLPAYAAAQQVFGPTAMSLRDGGRLLVRPGGFGLDVDSWSLSLPQPTLAIHVVREDFVLLERSNGFRFIAGGAAGSGQAAVLRTLPTQFARAAFRGTSADGEKLVFVSGPAAREEIDIRQLRAGHFLSVVTGGSAAREQVSEPLVTPIRQVFWRPVRPAGYLGPGHGRRADVIHAFSVPRPSERIEEYEPIDCHYPMHVAERNRVMVWVPTQTQVYEHTLRDRRGNQQIFFTALESGDVTYLSEPEATARGCDASYRRIEANAPRSYDMSRKLQYRSEYLVRLELHEAAAPAAGVMVRLREWRDRTTKPSCGEPSLGKVPDLGSEDGLTLADGAYVWKKERIRQGNTARRRLDIISDNVSATLCVSTEGLWIPIWHGANEPGGYRVRCDLATTGPRRCRQTR